MTHSSRHDEEYTPRVAALSKIDGFDVADGTPDPRGWKVRDASGTDIGKVHDLIVDTVAMRTRYLDIELDKKAVRLDKDRDVLVPVGQARLDDDDDCVILGSMTATRLASLPEYTHGDIDRDYENSLLPNFDAGAVDATNGGDSGAAIGAMSGERPGSQKGVIADAPESDFYDNRHFDEKSFFGTRRAQPQRSEPVKDTSIRKRADARQAAEPVTEKRDDVTVERHPIANADMASRSDIGDDEIRIPVYEDEIVVEKRRVLKEELVVKKSAVEDAQTAAGNPRKDKVGGGGSEPPNQSPADERR